MSLDFDEYADGPPNLLQDFTAVTAALRTQARIAKLAVQMDEAISSRPTEQLWMSIQNTLLERALLGETSAFMPLRSDMGVRLKDLGYRLRFHRRDLEQETYLRERVTEDGHRFARALEVLDQRSDVIKALFNQTPQSCPAFIQQVDACLQEPRASEVLIGRLSGYQLAKHLTLSRFEYLFEDAIQARRSMFANRARLNEAVELSAYMPPDVAEGYIVDWEDIQPKCERALSDFWLASHMAYVAEIAPGLVEDLANAMQAAGHEGLSHVALYLLHKEGEWFLLWDGSPEVLSSPSLAPPALAFVLRCAGYGVLEKPVFPFGKPNQAAASAQHTVILYWQPAKQDRRHLLYRHF
ncbi:hypothetical protein [Inhella gelatinilytica]|uniref:Uncharacterized protein n=1 Tax=Inhella gelatinilytica TaxID=2795030 RepID=A0A931NER7_9BURK|nr:hypothetical protein [Inhella gelatinilytica]MBH9553984.1 hypothetical protein [Inhella gelatinilytica]